MRAITPVLPDPRPFRRAIVVVLDGAGCGALPDAALYGDTGCDTLGHVAAWGPLDLPRLNALGLGRLVPGLRGADTAVCGAFGRLAEASPGKDSVTGHWELAGLVLDRAFPTYPDGFPPQTVAELARRIGGPVLGNVAASGTAVIERFGAEHVRTGRPILYTSVDSVCQIAAHEDVVPVARLYEICEAAFEVFGLGLGVSRVIARPFVGEVGAFSRTPRRHDFALPPPRETLLDRLSGLGYAVAAVGKVDDLFAGRGVTRSVRTSSDRDGLDAVLALTRELTDGVILANLVDFDTLYGHRNDVRGYARHLEWFDGRLAELSKALEPSDLLIVTADHGNDPTTAGTDHTREYVPLLVSGAPVRAGVDLGTRPTMADVGQTLADNFGVGPLAHGTSFLEAIVGEHS